MTNPNGVVALRERLRTTVRSDLARVAVEMFIERGFEATTVDAVAAAAGVSRSTFFRYFPTKEDAVLERPEARGEQFQQTAAARPADEPPLRVARAALTPLIEEISKNRERSIAVSRLIEQTPSLRARRLDRQSVLRAMLAEALAPRTGTDHGTDIRASLVADIALSLFEAAYGTWVKSAGPACLPDLVDHAFAVVGEEFAALSGPT